MWIIFAVNELLWKPELWELGSFPLVSRSDFLRFDGWNFYSVFSGENLLFIEESAEGAYYWSTYTSFLNVPWLLYLQRFFMTFAQINLALGIFNLLPIPPLDGYHVVNDIFLRGRLHIPAKVTQYLLIGLMVLMFMTDYISIAISKAVYFVQGGVVDLILAITGLR